MTNFIPGLCRIWTRVPAIDPYWVKMTYAARDYRGCVRIKQAYEARFPEREYRITADSDLCQPLVNVSLTPAQERQFKEAAKRARQVTPDKRHQQSLLHGRVNTYCSEK